MRTAILSALVALPLVAGAASSQSAPLERALDAISNAPTPADIAFLADDELQGRDTPSFGLRVAARFLRAQVQALGFHPGGGDDFLWEYDLEVVSLDGLASRIVVRDPAGEEQVLKYGRDYFFFRDVDRVDFSGDTRFAGTAGADELEGVDLGGSWAVVRDSERPWREVRANCREAGALGVIVVPDPEKEGPSSWQENGRWAPRTTNGALRLALAEREPIYPMHYFSPAMGTHLIAGRRELNPGDPLGFTVEEERHAKEPERITVENVCALWPGSDPKLANEVILVSAHYDHVGVMGGEIHNGADDNGSGTSGLLALARGLAAHGPLRRSVMLIWVSGEEKGLLGSEAWARDPSLTSDQRAVADINIDMIGRNAADSLLITPTAELDHYNGLTRLAEAHAPGEGFGPLGSADEYWERSDHASFAEHLGIPVCFLFSDIHEDYHQPTDDVEKIDTDKIQRVARLVMRMLAALQEDELTLN